MTAPPPNAPTPEKRALIDAYDQVMRVEAERRATDPLAGPGRRRPSLIVVTGLLIIAALGGVSYIVRPAWLFPAPPPATSQADLDAQLRVGLYMQAQRILAHRARTGRLPATLAEVDGAMLRDMTYSALDSTRFVVGGVAGPVSLTLQSDEDMRAFLGNSFAVVGVRRAR
jgi:hypothetical protein